jgi:RNA-directed DNA polymerase
VSQHSTVIQTSTTKLARIEVKSRQEPELMFSNLGHIIDELLLRECFNSLDGSKAIGIDGITKTSYGKSLNENLQSLLNKIRKGTYIPKPSRVVEIPKLDGTTRPLAIACLEDKIVQEACKRILERIF